jgi:putative DNA primase/helicase
MAGSEVLIEYLQRAIGYSLTGSTGEQCLFFAYGTGANGKTVLLETIQSLLGDYSLNAPADMLMMRQRGIPNDIARLSGARFVAMNETADCERLDEARVKDMTGGDTLTARFLRCEYFDFQPQYKLWIRGNHKPQISGTDDGIWRRLHLIPFTVQIPEAERDHNLSECLKRELPGILAWAVQGCLEWKRRGLKPPHEVRQAVYEYRSEMDVLGNFIDECCLIGSYQVKAKDLYDAYVEWARENGEYPVNKKKFGLALTERAFQRKRTREAWYYLGIELDVTDVMNGDGHHGFSRNKRAYLENNTRDMSQVSQSSPDAGNGKCAPCDRAMSCLLLVGQRELCDGPFPD